MEPKNNENQNIEIEALYKEYENRFKEMLFHSQNYHKQTNYLYYYTAVFATVISFIITASSDNRVLLNNMHFPELVLIALAAALFYIIVILLNSLYMVSINAQRLSAIEELLNRYIGTDLLVWDSKIVKKLYDPRFWNYNTWINPNYLVAISSFIFIIGMDITLILCATVFMPYMWKIFSILVFSATVFVAYQWIQLYLSGMKFIRSTIYQASGLEDKNLFSKNKYSDENNQNEEKNKTAYIVFIVTIILGPVTAMFLAYKTNTLWMNSFVHFPLITIPTVWFGDFILPFFNFRMIKLIQDAGILSIGKRKIIAKVILGVFISLIINIFTHLKWVSDPYTGFMDIELGYLSTAGYMHFLFSIIQMTIVFCFLIGAFYCYKKRFHKLYNYAIKSWYLFVLFTTISIADFTIRHKLVLEHDINLLLILHDWMSLITLVFALIVLIFFKRGKSLLLNCKRQILPTYAIRNYLR